MSYLLKDLKSAFEYGQKNPNAKLKDWIEYSSQFINNEELKLYKNVEYDKFLIKLGKKSYEFILLKLLSQELLENVVKKIVGNREYYQLNLMPGEWHSPILSIISFDKDFFTLNKWKDNKSFKGIKQISNDDNSVVFSYELDTEDWDNEDYNNYSFYKRNLEIECKAFWDYQSTLYAYINTEVMKFNFKPVSELFKQSKTKKNEVSVG